MIRPCSYSVQAQPNSELSKFINAYKSASSRLIKKEYPIIKKSLWKNISGQEASVYSLQAVRRLKLSSAILKVKVKRYEQGL